MLTVPRFTNLELGVVAALPMQHQMHFLTFETSDDLSKDGTQDALACFCCCGWTVPREKMTGGGNVPVAGMGYRGLM
jgi:hypothetical protein